MKVSDLPRLEIGTKLIDNRTGKTGEIVSMVIGKNLRNTQLKARTNSGSFVIMLPGKSEILATL